MPLQETVIVLALAPWTEHVTILVGVVLPKEGVKASTINVAGTHNFANIILQYKLTSRVSMAPSLQSDMSLLGHI
jgi:hypothetical protein